MDAIKSGDEPSTAPAEECLGATAAVVSHMLGRKSQLSREAVSGHQRRGEPTLLFASRAQPPSSRPSDRIGIAPVFNARSWNSASRNAAPLLFWYCSRSRTHSRQPA